jgi:hypothetical protein
MSVVASPWLSAIAGCGFVDGGGAPLPFRMAKGFQDAAVRAGMRLAPVDDARLWITAGN